MKGLLVKDFELLKMQKKFFITLLVVGALLNFSTSKTFAVGYFTFVCATFVTSTLSYDEFDNGLVFLLTLPISRKNYVVAKYVFGAIVIFCAWLAGVAVTVICSFIRETGITAQDTLSMVIMLPIGFVVDAAMLPFIIKFGQEKGRYVSIGVLGAVFAASLGIAYLSKHTNIAEKLSNIQEVGAITIVAAVVMIGLALYGLSCLISIKIFNKKVL